MAQLVLPYYNQLVDKNFLLITPPGSSGFWPGIDPPHRYCVRKLSRILLVLFQPTMVLKGKPNIGKGASTPRKVLVTLQFGFSILLIIGTMVIYQQIQLVKSREIGYDQENLMAVNYTNEVKKTTVL